MRTNEEEAVSRRDASPGSHVSRRDALRWLGAAGIAGIAAACTSPSSSTDAAGSGSGGGATPSCVLSPEMTEGPYHIDGEAVRSVVTEGKAGAPLRLALTVVDATTCSFLPKAAVEIWHADAGGNYSGFGATESNTTFLRGVQIADAIGKVHFTTVYPGWYMGRATHIHLMVHVDGNVVHTGQLFFDEAINDAVYARAPYNAHTGQRMFNDQDGIFANGGAASTVALTKDGDGYVGAITLGVRS
jgi:protocatechuate 3,4-dioxygenase beta subunit